jgi:hypothetical protein
LCIGIAAGLAGVGWNSAHAGLPKDDPFADVLVSYEPGVGQEPGYFHSLTALGSPERYTGEIFDFPLVVSAFNPPFGTDEIVSLGAGGHITLMFNTPVTDDPNNLYGIDLLIFGNTGFIDSVGTAAGLFGNDGGIVEVSVDGTNWVTIPKVIADGPIPTLGYLDSGEYDAVPGRVPTDFTRPFDPLWTIESFDGLTHAQIVERYSVNGSGGGTGIDLASVGLSQISYVRISNSLDAQENVEVDAVSDVSPRVPGDANLDGIVNIDDLLLLIGVWGPVAPGKPPADFDNNGVVNVDDLLAIIGGWS